MKQRVCRTCGSVLKEKVTEKGQDFFCAKCEVFPEFDEVEMEPHCPDCGVPISHVFTCCQLAFFCSKCEAQKTNSKIVWKR